MPFFGQAQGPAPTPNLQDPILCRRPQGAGPAASGLLLSALDRAEKDGRGDSESAVQPGREVFGKVERELEQERIEVLLEFDQRLARHLHGIGLRDEVGQKPPDQGLISRMPAPASLSSS